LINCLFFFIWLRLLWATGASTPTGAFVVGLYIDQKFFAKGSGETLDIAEEMAARDGLRRLFGTTEEAAPLPFGQKARQFSQIINAVYEKLQKSK
jgi:large subunit ribosomal protein L44